MSSSTTYVQTQFFEVLSDMTIRTLTLGDAAGYAAGVALVNFYPGTVINFAGAVVENLTIPGPNALAQHTFYVALGGIDAPGNGNILTPFASIPFAISQISGATNIEPWIVNVSAGAFPGACILPPNVTILGAGTTATSLTGAVSISSGWNNNTPKTSALQNISLYSVTYNTLQYASSANSNLNMRDCYIENTMITNVKTTDTFNCNDCTFGDTISGTGGVNNLIGCSAGSGATSFYDSSSGQSCSVVSNDTVYSILNVTQSYATVSVALRGGYVYDINLTGVVSISATCGSLPPKASVSLGGNTLTTICDAYTLGYTPATPSNWTAPAPTTVQKALDAVVTQPQIPSYVPIYSVSGGTVQFITPIYNAYAGNITGTVINASFYIGYTVSTHTVSGTFSLDVTLPAFGNTSNMVNDCIGCVNSTWDGGDDSVSYANQAYPSALLANAFNFSQTWSATGLPNGQWYAMIVLQYIVP